MRKVIRKWFWAWNFEKEEQWLNEMSAKGLALVDYTFCRYVFEECGPGEYVYKIQLLENLPSHPESEQYIRFVEDAGIEEVASYMRWVYFRKKNDGAPFELFSDIGSRIKHLKTVNALLLTLFAANVGVGFSNTVNLMYNAPGFAWLPLLNFAVAALLGLGIYKLQKKINVLKKEQTIRE